MGERERQDLIQQLEVARKSKVICYLTSLKPNVNAHMAEDAVRIFFDHLLKISTKPIPQLDVYLCSNGGSGTVPWRLVSLFREYAKRFCVLVPYRAYSAATLLALGADEIVMLPFSELGPIDPTVNGPFNPRDAAGQPQGISVEDVTAYVTFIKSTVGITHEDELIEAIKILATNVHPLALGNIERFLSQSRMVARKILKTHMDDLDSHAMSEIVETMASKLYFHGHPINRKEALNDLHLKVVDVPANIEDLMWRLYLSYEASFGNRTVFDPAADLARDVVNQLNAAQAVAIQSPPGVPPSQTQIIAPAKLYRLLLAVIESAGMATHCNQSLRVQWTGATPPINVMNLGQDWADVDVEAEPSQASPLTTEVGAVPLHD